VAAALNGRQRGGGGNVSALLRPHVHASSRTIGHHGLRPPPPSRDVQSITSLIIDITIVTIQVGHEWPMATVWSDDGRVADAAIPHRPRLRVFEGGAPMGEAAR
jgi:hypothetical protein